MIENDLIAARVIARERVACDVISLRLVSDAPDFALPRRTAGAGSVSCHGEGDARGVLNGRKRRSASTRGISGFGCPARRSG
ncbi:hypothetical protein BW685_14165 [Burkholderia ubonensis]|uniref:Uncharacterized protein n=1 Tax=Burkholderia ubonensis TaxID=101571 RepID=A0A1R1JCC1_9BURK|nr:hypothetical protein BW685_14165 [Burkholderia ubonensis]